MKLVFLIPLLKDSANSKGGGVAIHSELLIKLGLV